MSDNVTLTLTHEFTDHEVDILWDGVWSDVEYGACNYWLSDLTLVRADSDEGRVVTALEFASVDDPNTTLVVDKWDIWIAFRDIMQGDVKCGYPKKYMQNFVATRDGGVMDADSSDVLLQVAAFGEIVYG